MEYLLLVFSNWAPDFEAFAQSLSVWHIVGAVAVLLVAVMVAIRAGM
jgi:hypothetical protein